MLLFEYVIPFILILSVLVFVHEYGHFWVARRCGVFVEVFSIGFGREVFGWNDRHGTRWCVAMLPLGGYVRMRGDGDEASSLDRSTLDQLAAAERDSAFATQPVINRIAIVVAGPAANLLFAVVVMAGMFMTVGQSSTPAVVGGIVDTPAEAVGLQQGDRLLSLDGERINGFAAWASALARVDGNQPASLDVERDGHTATVELDWQTTEWITARLGTDFGLTVGAALTENPAERAGLQPGDRFLTLDGKKIARFEDFARIVSLHPEQELIAEIERSGTVFTTTLIPDRIDLIDSYGNPQSIGRVGISGGFEMITHGPVDAVVEAVRQTWILAGTIFEIVGQIVFGERSTNEIGGVGRIAHVSGEVAQMGIVPVLQFMALLSINLALINLLPVPMLDGGHLLFFAIEALRGKPLPLQLQNASLRFGFGIVLALIVFASWNDLVYFGALDFFGT